MGSNMVASGWTQERVGDAPTDRRRHRRLAIRLPVECLIGEKTAGSPLRAMTHNISAGGVYFDAPPGVLQPGAGVELVVTVPPGEGYSPYAGRVRGPAEIVRVEPLASHPNGMERVGVAARFREELQLSF